MGRTGVILSKQCLVLGLSLFVVTGCLIDKKQLNQEDDPLVDHVFVNAASTPGPCGNVSFAPGLNGCYESIAFTHCDGKLLVPFSSGDFGGCSGSPYGIDGKTVSIGTVKYSILPNGNLQNEKGVVFYRDMNNQIPMGTTHLKDEVVELQNLGGELHLADFGFTWAQTLLRAPFVAAPIWKLDAKVEAVVSLISKSLNLRSTDPAGKALYIECDLSTDKDFWDILSDAAKGVCIHRYPGIKNSCQIGLEPLAAVQGVNGAVFELGPILASSCVSYVRYSFCEADFETKFLAQLKKSFQGVNRTKCVEKDPSLFPRITQITLESL